MAANTDLSAWFRDNGGQIFSSGEDSWNKLLEALQTACDEWQGLGAIVADMIATNAVTRDKILNGEVITAKLAALGVTAATIENNLDLSGSKNAKVQSAMELYESEESTAYNASEIGCIAYATKLLAFTVEDHEPTEEYWAKLPTTVGRAYRATITAEDLGITDGETDTLPDDYTVYVEMDRTTHSPDDNLAPLGIAIGGKIASNFNIYIMVWKGEGSGEDKVFYDPALDEFSSSCTITVSVFAKR